MTIRWKQISLHLAKICTIRLITNKKILDRNLEDRKSLKLLIPEAATGGVL